MSVLTLPAKNNFGGGGETFIDIIATALTDVIGKTLKCFVMASGILRPEP
jgi:hypothetical protein